MFTDYIAIAMSFAIKASIGIYWFIIALSVVVLWKIYKRHTRR